MASVGPKPGWSRLKNWDDSPSAEPDPVWREVTETRAEFDRIHDGIVDKMYEDIRRKYLEDRWD